MYTVDIERTWYLFVQCFQIYNLPQLNHGSYSKITLFYNCRIFDISMYLVLITGNTIMGIGQSKVFEKMIRINGKIGNVTITYLNLDCYFKMKGQCEPQSLVKGQLSLCLSLLIQKRHQQKGPQKWK